MRRIGLLSDTHGFLDKNIFEFFQECDEIWHAGDIGNIETLDRLAEFKPLKGAYGNIDDKDVRLVFKKHMKFRCEDLKVWITHIGGYPGRYDHSVKPGIFQDSPDLFICGHSHILKVIFDKKFNFLYINPGAAGNSGFHQVKTLIRFTIEGKDIRDLEVMEIQRNSV